MLERIFDPYFTTDELGGGSGMGLAVVYGIVKSYSGAITVQSELEKGAAFHVFFPRIEPTKGDEETKVVESLPTGDERILLVDDELALVDMGKQMLEHLGYEVISRTSSIEALEAFRAKPERFDLVITDMAMPNMTGVDLAKELMNIRRDIPVILCTGFSEKISEENAKAMGIQEFLMKPLVIRGLAETIRRVFDKKIGE